MKATALLLLAVVAAGLASHPARAETQLTAMSFNIYGGKNLDDIAAAIRAAKADIVGVQEVRGEKDPCLPDDCPADGPSVAADLAAKLGFHVYEQKASNEALWANAIVSRYPIGQATPHDLGVRVDVEGRKVLVFNVHLDDSPYQPYQVMKIEYGAHPFLTTAEDAVKAAEDTRGGAVRLLAEDLAAGGAADLVLLFGDFNEPSHLDWTEPAVKAGLQPMVVPYPTSRAVAGMGFVDTFRAANPDVAAKPGMTWTPTTEPTDPADHHDRIDFVYAMAPGLRVIESGVVGEKAPQADIVVSPWGSDHRAVYSRLAF